MSLFSQFFQGSTFVTVANLLTCLLGLGLFFRFFKAPGVMVYMGLAAVCGNIQVLKTTPLWGYSDPVAMGTVTFGTLFFASDLLVEFYDAKMARKGIHVSLLSMGLFTLWMSLTILAPSVSDGGLQDQVQSSLLTLFGPAPSLLAASLLAYVLSQYTDVWIYASLKRLTGDRWIWARALLSSLIAGFLDNVVFTLLAFRVFLDSGLETRTLWFGYILGTYPLRMGMAFLGSCLVWFIRRTSKKLPIYSHPTF